MLQDDTQSPNEAVSVRTLAHDTEAKRRLFSRALDAAAIDQQKVLSEYQRLMHKTAKK